MVVDIPEILNDVDGETIGQKIEKITICMGTIAFSAKKVARSLSSGEIEVDSTKHNRMRKTIDELYEKWEDRLIAVMQTGVGDWIRGTKLFDDFIEAGEQAHGSIVRLIKEEHARRELKEIDENE